MPVDEFSEQPRPNLYNVIKKLREQKGKQFHRLVYIARLDESQFRGDFERELIQWVENVANQQDEDEIPLEEGMKLEYSGYAVVMGPWYVHLLEAEQTLMYRLVKRLDGDIGKKGSHYKNAWVLHYTEDVATRAYHNWYCKSIPAAQATREIKTLSDAEKIEAIYEAMIQVGKLGQDAASKGETAVIA